MMLSNPTMKVTPKRSEAVIPDDPRVGIGLDTVSELLQQHLQQQTVSLDALMMMFRSVLIRATSARHRK
jgi:hypothetical protein